MKTDFSIQTRRQFLQNIAFGAVTLAAGEALAENLARTPRQTEGPFYPDKLPPDTDNDLLLVNDSVTRAAGEITHLRGRVLDPTGSPVPNAVVEIWQVDNNGIYLHTGCPNRDKRDERFQGFGRFLTGRTGEYYFRTIKPVAYTLGITRTPHIHVVVNKGAERMLTTQLYIKGHPLNRQDIVLRGIRGKTAREAVLVDFKPLKGSRLGELAANFDIVIGTTPEDPSEDIFQARDGAPVGKHRKPGD
jgi:protocatechuate 3,4-dioxygenase beta subunit